MTKFITILKCLTLSCCLLMVGTLQAQQESSSTITINIKMTDAQGNATNKTIVEVVDDANQDYIQSLVDEAVGDFAGNVEVNVNVESISSSNSPEIESGEEIEVTVDEEGNVFINGEPVEEGEYGNQQIIIIESDDSEEVGDVQEMLDEMDIDINIEEIIDGQEGEKEIRIVKKVITSEEENDGSGFLGVHIEDTPSATGGVKVIEIVEGSAAQKAGLQKGDIIKTIDGQPINNYKALVKAISSHQANETIRVGYERNGTPNSQEIALGKNEHNRANVFVWDDNKSWVDKPHRRKRMRMDCSKMSKEECMKMCEDMSKEECMKMCEGMSKEECIRICGFDCSKNSKGEKPRLGVEIEETNGKKGVLVSDITEDSPAEKAGLLPNDIILKVDKTKVNSVNELIQAVRAHKVGDKVKIQYLRSGNKKKASLTLDATPQNRFFFGCCKDGKKSKENITEQRIIIKTIDDEGNVVEEVVDGSLENDFNNTLQLDMIDLFPNPTSGNINVKFQTPQKSSTSVRILDVTGKEIYVKEITDFNGYFNETINLENNLEGIYLFNIKQGDKVFTEKIILSK